jgi:hypothetical protein
MMQRLASFVLVVCVLAAVQARELQQAKFMSVGDALTSPQNAQLSTLLAAVKVISVLHSHSSTETLSALSGVFLSAGGSNSRHWHLAVVPCGSDTCGSDSTVQTGSFSIQSHMWVCLCPHLPQSATPSNSCLTWLCHWLSHCTAACGMSACCPAPVSVCPGCPVGC